MQLEENSGFSGGNGRGLVLMVDRGFSEKWGFLGKKKGENGKNGGKNRVKNGKKGGF